MANNNAHENRIVKIIFSVFGIIIFSKLLGFVKQMIVANAFGATIDTDIVMLSHSLISNIDLVFYQVFMTALIPLYIGIGEEKKREQSMFFSNTLVIWIGISLIISVGIIALSGVLTRIIVPNYSGELAGQLAKYIRLFAPALVIAGMGALLSALLRANKRFIPGEMGSVFYSCFTIILTFSFKSFLGVNVLIIAYYAYIITNLIYLLLVGRKYWSFIKSGSYFDDNVKKFIKMSFPLLFGYGMVFINQSVDAIVSANLGEGTVSSLGYATVLFNVITALTGSMCAVIYTYISKAVADNDSVEAGKIVEKSVIAFSTLLIPLGLLLVFNSVDIVNVVFKRGAFSDAAVSTTSSALVGYGVAAIFLVTKDLFGRLQYCYLDSWRPMRNSSIGIVLNIFLDIVLAKRYGILGITLATSASIIISALLNIISSRRYNKSVNGKAFIRIAWKWIIGAVLCALTSYAGQRIFSNSSSFLRLFLIAIISLLLFYAVSFSEVRTSVRLFMKSKEE